jgi:hypothetical protein
MVAIGGRFALSLSKIVDTGCRVVLVLESRARAKTVRPIDMSITTPSMIGELKRRDEAKCVDKTWDKALILDLIVDNRMENGIVYFLATGFLSLKWRLRRR